MGRHHSDSEDSYRSHKKKKRRSRSRSNSYSSDSSRSRKSHRKSKKSHRKHASRSRSRSAERAHRRRHRDSRSKSRDRRRSRSRSHSRSRQRSPGKHRRAKSRSRSPRKRSTSPKRRSRSPRRRSTSPKGTSRSSSRSRSKRDRDSSRTSPSSRIVPGIAVPPAKQAEIQLQLALKAAAAADEKLKEAGLLPEGVGRRVKDVELSAQEIMERVSALDAINSESFQPQHFSSSRTQKQTSGFDTAAEATHDNAIFSSLPLNIKADTGITSQDNSYRLTSGTHSLMHPNLYVGGEEKMEKWRKKLMAMRSKKLEGEEM